MDLALGSPTIPVELIDQILDLLWDDQEALKQCCLASRSFLHTCQNLIFECIWLEGMLNNGYPLSDGRTMAQRLERLLKSSPHLALLIKDLRIINNCDSPHVHAQDRWLEDDKSLPFILPLLVNLERFYVANGRTDAFNIYFTELPKPVQEALFATWRSPKLTHLGLAFISFPLFQDILSVISQSSHSVRNIYLCATSDELVDSDEAEVDANHDSDINGQSVIPRLSSVAQSQTQTRVLESLTFSPCGGESSADFYTWLLNPKPDIVCSSLRKLDFYVGGRDSYQEDLSIFRLILAASPSLEELHVAMYMFFGTFWTDSGPHEPIDISSIRVLHLVVDLLDSGLPILDWWCDSLASARSLALEDLEIYSFPAFYKTPEIALDLVPEWKRLDNILSSTGRDINLKIRLLPPNGGGFCLVPEDLWPCFPRLREKGRLDVGCVDEIERRRQVEGILWL